jgi:hypothetical protein
VHIGARVSAVPGPNDVLLSSTLRDLVIGSELEFEDLGVHQLKGAVAVVYRRFFIAVGFGAADTLAGCVEEALVRVPFHVFRNTLIAG